MRLARAVLGVLLFWCLMYYIGIEMERPDLSFGDFMTITAIVAAGGLAGGD